MVVSVVPLGCVDFAVPFRRVCGTFVCGLGGICVHFAWSAGGLVGVLGGVGSLRVGVVNMCSCDFWGTVLFSFTGTGVVVVVVVVFG